MCSGVPASIISTRFHRALAAVIVAAAEDMRRRYHIDTAALSGGVFQNVTLLEGAKRGLEEAGFSVLTHRLVPPNDGGHVVRFTPSLVITTQEIEEGLSKLDKAIATLV